MLVLPWDAAATASHEILCAYNSEGIVNDAAATSTYCAHHVGVVGSTQDQDALDFDLKPDDTVRAVAPGYVRWAGAYPNTKSWSCYGVSIAIDTPLADGTVVTTFYAHLGSLVTAAGDVVKGGDPIAKSGSSGGGSFPSVCSSAYSPHLHVGVYTNAGYVASDGSSITAVALLAKTTATEVPTVASPALRWRRAAARGMGQTAQGHPPSRHHPLCSDHCSRRAPCWRHPHRQGPGERAHPHPDGPAPRALGYLGCTRKWCQADHVLPHALGEAGGLNPADVKITKVTFSAAWGTTAPKPACTATAAGAGGVWSCKADLWKLGAPVGKVTLGFDVYDDAGDLTHSPAGTRTVTLSASTTASVKVPIVSCPTDYGYFDLNGNPVTAAPLPATETLTVPIGGASQVAVYATNDYRVLAPRKWRCSGMEGPMAVVSSRSSTHRTQAPR